MHYFVSETASDGSVYSCDKICIMGKIYYTFCDTFSSDLSMFFIKYDLNSNSNVTFYPFVENIKGLKKYHYFERMNISSFRNNFNIDLTDDTSFFFAYKHNSQLGNNTDVSWKLELNPNKCLPCDFVTDFISFLASHSKPTSIRISQMDIAIDFREKRNNVYLVKDRRVHTRIDSGSDNVTEYLSKHNQHGFVKLYNKTAESNLDYVLTRLEITVKEFTWNDFLNVFPSVHVYSDSQITFDDKCLDLSQNDEVFLSLLRLHPEYLCKLTYRKQQKFQPYIQEEAPIIVPDMVAYLNLLERVRDTFYVSK